MAATYGTYAAPRADLGEAFLEYSYDQVEFIGTQLFPIAETPKKKATFTKITREKALMPGNVRRAPKGSYNRDSFEGEDQAYECEEYGKEYPLDHGEREFYANDFDAEATAIEMAGNHLLLAQEIRLAAIALNTTTRTTGNGLRTDVSAAWGTVTTDIIGDVMTAKESVRTRTGMDPNVLAFGKAVLPYLVRNTALRASLQYVQLPTVDAFLASLAALFGLERVIMGGAVQNTAIEKTAASLSDIWGSGWAIVAKVANPGDKIVTPCVGRTMLWVSDSPEAVMAEEYEEPQTRSTVYRARHHVDELEIDTSFLQLLDIAA